MGCLIRMSLLAAARLLGPAGRGAARRGALPLTHSDISGVMNVQPYLIKYGPGKRLEALTRLKALLGGVPVDI